MNGILVIDKPKGYTSRDIVNIVGKKLGTKKVGHTGTLDPIATGVLVLLIGKSLKLTELLVSDNKEYIATIKLGIETDTLDSTGNVINRKPVNDISRDDVILVLDKFKGRIIQEVPKYSAVHVNGKRLYEYARNNMDVELPKREIMIEKLDLIGDIINDEFSIRCLVSKGTYIRSLVRDIGRSLDNYGTMTELRRIKQGLFDIKDANTLEDIENGNYKIIDPINVLNIPKVVIDDDMIFKIKNGQVLKKFFEGEMVMILDKANNLLAIYKDMGNGYVKPFKMFVN